MENKNWIHYLKGDKGIWSFVILLAIFSFLPVFSSSSNLAYAGQGTGNTLSFLAKHFVHISVGIFIMYQTQRIPHQYWRNLSYILLAISWVLLIYTLFKGQIIAGANASRWIMVPVIGVSFQPSTIAFMVLMIYVSRYLAKHINEPQTFNESLRDLWLPVGVTLLLILPANFSTAALIFSMVLMLTFIGCYPIKHTAKIVVSGLALLVMFFLIAKAFPSKLTSRVSTWEARLERFWKPTEKDSDEMYQVERAKTAIATGGIQGLGPGKSVQRNFLPQSSSDFIYAIIIEEFGLIGGATVLMLYILLFIRFIITAGKANSPFGKFVIIGLGFPIIFQALINMGVAVSLLPVTGQPLPLVSSGGTSIWITCIALGIILNVTKKEEEIEAEKVEQQKRDEALQRLIDQQLLAEAAEQERLALEALEKINSDGQ